VRYGIRKAGDPLMEDSLRVVDAALKVNTPYGPCWRRYNYDGYGPHADGKPYTGWGVGRAWPLLTGERAHYELAAGRDIRPLITAIERFASSSGMLPEQVWDAPAIPEASMFPGKPCGAAMPLMWAHAEYIKLLRSLHDEQVFDRIPAVADRYLNKRGRSDLEVIAKIESQNPSLDFHVVLHRLSWLGWRCRMSYSAAGRGSRPA
jgi:glucoamylase